VFDIFNMLLQIQKTVYLLVEGKKNTVSGSKILHQKGN